MSANQKLIIVLVVVIAVAYLLFSSGYMGKKKGEKFTWANAVESQPGSYNLAPKDYDLLNDPREYESTQSKFADIVGPAQLPSKEGFCRQAAGAGDLPLPVRSFDDTDSQNLLPSDPTSVTMFDRDVTDPALYLYRPSIRAQIKNRQHATADPFRGDLPIVPCNRGWFQSRYGPGDAKLDGYFSAYTNEKYAALTGQANLPMQMSNEEVLMDYQDPILSHY